MSSGHYFRPIGDPLDSGAMLPRREGMLMSQSRLIGAIALVT